MNDLSWLNIALERATRNVQDEADAATTKTKDALRHGLHGRLKALLEQPLPNILAMILSQLEEFGYHLHSDIYYDYSTQSNELAVGMTDERFLFGTDQVSWRKLRSRHSVWTHAHAISSKNTNLVFAVEVIPQSAQDVTYRLFAGTQMLIESADPDQFDPDSLRDFIQKNIVKNGLTPRTNK